MPVSYWQSVINVIVKFTERKIEMSNPDHICLDCKHNQLIESNKDDAIFHCAKGLVEDWSIGFYRNIFSCDEFELIEEEQSELNHHYETKEN